MTELELEMSDMFCLPL